MKRNLLLAAASTAALIAALELGVSGAAAQQAPPGPAQVAGGAVKRPAQIEEVTVTAQKRPEKLQKTPAAIVSLPGAVLKRAGVNSMEALGKLVPDVDVRNNGGGVQLYIRGVGSQVANGFGDPAVAFSVDGVYFSRPVGPDLTLYDISRVEVVKGPQGTLYGRNATGGAINLVTNKPSTTAGVTGDLLAEVGDYNLVHFEGGVNLPVNDSLAFRVSGEHISHAGYMSDGYDDQNVDAGRISMLWRPSDDLRIDLSGNYGFQGGMGSGYVPHDGSFVTDDPYQGPSSPAVRAYVLSKGQIPPQQFTDQDALLDNRVWGLNATIVYDLGFADVTVLPAYMHTSFDDNFYIGSLGQVQSDRDDQETVEARIAGKPGQRLQWLAGFFFLNEQQNFSSFNQANQGLSETYIETPDLADRSYAGFGQATYAILPDLRITGGLRYTYEHKTSTNGIYGVVPDPAGLLLPPAVTGLPFPIPVHLQGGTEPSNGDQQFYNLSYRAGLEYDVTPSSLVYGNISTGFHAGGLNPGSLTPTYAPEKLTAYAIGSKNRFLDNRLQLNAEAFYWTYDNLQIQHLGPVISPGGEAFTGFITDNAGRARLYGVDANAALLLTDYDRLDATLLFDETEYVKYAYNVVISGTPPQAINASGEPLINAPKWSGTIGFAHTIPLDDAKIVASVNTRLSSSFHGSPLNEPGTIQSGYSRTDLGITYDAPQDRWSLTAYVRNVEDRAVISLVTNRNPATRDAFYGTPAAMPGAVSGTFVTLDPPRTFGLLATLHF